MILYIETNLQNWHFLQFIQSLGSIIREVLETYNIQPSYLTEDWNAQFIIVIMRKFLPTCYIQVTIIQSHCW